MDGLKVSRFQVYWSATLPHKSPHVANTQVNGSLNSTQSFYFDKLMISSTLSKLSRINANLPCCQCTSSHDDLYILHIYIYISSCAVHYHSFNICPFIHVDSAYVRFVHVYSVFLLFIQLISIRRWSSSLHG